MEALVYFVLLPVLGFMVLRDPYFGAMAIVLLVLMGGAHDTPSIEIANRIIGALSLTVASFHFFLGRVGIRRPDLLMYLYIVLYIVIAILSLAFNGFFIYDLQAIENLFVGFCIFILLILTVDSTVKLQGLLLIIVAAGLATSIDAIYLFQSMQDGYSIKRITAMFQQVNYAAFIGVLSMISWSIYCSTISDSKRLVPFSIIIYGALLFPIVIGESRAGLFMLLIFVVCRVFWSVRMNFLSVVSMVLSIGVLVLFTFSILQTLDSIIVGRELRFFDILLDETRFNSYRAGLYAFSDNMFSGVGIGNWKPSVQWEYRDEIGHVAGSPHNVFIGALAEMGLIGLTVLLLIYYELFKRMRIVQKGTGNRLLSASVTSMYLTALVIYPSFHSKSISREMFIVMGIMLIIYKLKAVLEVRNQREKLSNSEIIPI